MAKSDKSIAELQAELRALQEALNERIKTERYEVITTIQEQIATYGIQADDLFPPARTKNVNRFVDSKGPKLKLKSGARYKNPDTGEVYTVKPGKRPLWISNATQDQVDLWQAPTELSI